MARSAEKTLGLRWVHSPDTKGFTAMSGELHVGFVGQREDGTCYYDAAMSVRMRGIARTHNFAVADLETAKLGVERAWAAFLSKAKLVPIQGDGDV